MQDMAGAPAPPEIAVQIYNRGIMPLMFAKLFNGQSVGGAVVWAEEELQGLMW
jgi:hypothetical protein